MPKMLKVRDRSDNYTIDKGLLPNIPYRGILSMRTGQGKTSIITNLLCNPDFNYHDFIGDDIFIYSPLINDDKLEMCISAKDIPEENLHKELDNESLSQIYDEITREYTDRVAKNKSPFPKLFIFDDLSFDGSLRKGNFNMINKIFCNGRKHQISVIITSQYYNHILPSCRANASFILLGDMSDRQLDIVTDENNYLSGKSPKASFKRMVRATIGDKHDFIIINYSNPKEFMYLNKDFEPINWKEFENN